MKRDQKFVIAGQCRQRMIRLAFLMADLIAVNLIDTQVFTGLNILQ